MNYTTIATSLPKKNKKTSLLLTNHLNKNRMQSLSKLDWKVNYTVFLEWTFIGEFFSFTQQFPLSPSRWRLLLRKLQKNLIWVYVKNTFNFVWHVISTYLSVIGFILKPTSQLPYLYVAFYLLILNTILSSASV